MSGSLTLIALGIVSLVALAALCGCVYIYFKHQSLQEEFLISRNVQLRPSDVYKLMDNQPSVIESTLGNVLRATVNGDAANENESEHEPQPQPEPPTQPEPQPQQEDAQPQQEDAKPQQEAQPQVAPSECESEAGLSEVVSDAESVTEVAAKPRRRRTVRKDA